jgi:hypothetical protein
VRSYIEKAHHKKKKKKKKEKRKKDLVEWLKV